MTGLIDSIIEAAIIIDSGRRGFAIIGEERVGRISYEKGIAAAFKSNYRAKQLYKKAKNRDDGETAITHGQTSTVGNYTKYPFQKRLPTPKFLTVPPESYH